MSSTIKRSSRKNNFVQIDKRALQDKNLSWKAKGLLSYILSLPDDWQMYVSELTNHSTDGKSSTTTALKELMAAGYVYRYTIRGEDGTFSGYTYEVYETPKDGQTEDGLTDSRKPDFGKSDFGKPNTTNNNNTNNHNTNNYNTNSDLQSQDGSENTFISPPDLEKEKSSAKKEKDPAVEVIEYFNSVTGQSRSTARSGRGSSNVRWVRGLLSKGYTVEEVKLMIDVKVYEWGDNPKMARHINPVTLFKRHGEEYIEDALHMRDNPQSAQALKESKGKKGYAPTVSQSDYENLKNW